MNVLVVGCAGVMDSVYIERAIEIFEGFFGAVERVVLLDRRPFSTAVMRHALLHDRDFDVCREPEWKKYGKKAGWMRSEQAVSHTDGVIAVWDGRDRIVEIVLSIAERLGKPKVSYRPRFFCVR